MTTILYDLKKKLEQKNSEILIFLVFLFSENLKNLVKWRSLLAISIKIYKFTFMYQLIKFLILNFIFNKIVVQIKKIYRMKIKTFFALL